MLANGVVHVGQAVHRVHEPLVIANDRSLVDSPFGLFLAISCMSLGAIEDVARVQTANTADAPSPHPAPPTQIHPKPSQDMLALQSTPSTSATNNQKPASRGQTKSTSHVPLIFPIANSDDDRLATFSLDYPPRPSVPTEDIYQLLWKSRGRTIRELEVKGYRGYGSVWDVYEPSVSLLPALKVVKPVVVKICALAAFASNTNMFGFSHRHSISTSVKTEASIYQKLENLQGHAIPETYGNFESEWRGCKVFLSVIEDAGSQMEVGMLTSKQRYVTIDSVQHSVRSYLIRDLYDRLHDCGVVHGDVESRHWLWKEGVPKLINFDHAFSAEELDSPEDFYAAAEREIKQVQAAFAGEDPEAIPF